MTYHTLNSIKDKLAKGDYVEIYGGLAGPKLFAGYCTEIYANAFTLQEYRRLTGAINFIDGPAQSYEFVSPKPLTAVIYKSI